MNAKPPVPIQYLQKGDEVEIATDTGELHKGQVQYVQLVPVAVILRRTDGLPFTFLGDGFSLGGHQRVVELLPRS